jgi:hypothetical protein
MKAQRDADGNELSGEEDKNIEGLPRWRENRIW